MDFLPKYLYSYLTFLSQEYYPLRSVLTNKRNVIPSRKKTFFPYSINEWNNLSTKVRDDKSIKFFKKMVVTENKENPIFPLYDSPSVKLLTLLIKFSHLNEHKFRHGFGDTVSSMCGCNAQTEDKKCFLLHCLFHSIHRFELFNNINEVNLSFT